MRDEQDHDATSDMDEDEASEASDVDYAEYASTEEEEAISEAGSEGSGTFQVWDGDGYAA